MHEIAIAEKIIREAKKQKQNIKAIEIEVGELEEIEAHEVEEVLQSLTKWKIKVNEKKSKIKCECGYEGRANILDKGHGYCVYNCPQCEKKPEVLEGGDIKIIKLD